MIIKLLSRVQRSFSSVIQQVQEIQKAHEFFEKGKIIQAEQFYSRGLSILPPYQLGTSTQGIQDDYNADYNQALLRLLKCFVMQEHYGKVRQLLGSKDDEWQKGWSKEILYLADAVKIVQGGECTFTDLQIIKAKLVGVQNAEMVRLLLRSDFQNKQNESQLSPFPHLLSLASLPPRQLYLQILTGILQSPLFKKNVNYLKLCSSFLVSVEKDNKEQIVKALTVTVINLILKEQYMHAEGVINYCVSEMEKKGGLLMNNQQWILLKLLRSHLLTKLKRESEAETLQLQYSTRLNVRSLAVQALIL